MNSAEMRDFIVNLTAHAGEFPRYAILNKRDYRSISAPSRYELRKRRMLFKKLKSSYKRRSE